MDLLEPLAFSPATRAWFKSAFDQPTDAQIGAWRAIAEGDDVLVVAPTGSGKTLSAFLFALDRLAFAAENARPPGTSVLYVSPLKALAVDVERNLRSPLAGLNREAILHGIQPRPVTVGVRSGDTPQSERRRLITHPPDILITTPESLFLILTSSARESLRNVHTVIVDEVHAVAATKRGVHLAVSLDRLDALLESPAQRIGLSATVSPPEEVARFIRPGGRVALVQPPSTKEFDLRISVPVDDMGAIAGHSSRTSSAQDATGSSGVTANPSIWPHVEEQIVDLIAQHRSTIVFANSRRLAERLTARLNEIWYERISGAPAETATAAETGRLRNEDPRSHPREARESDSPDGSHSAGAVPCQPAQVMAQAGSSAGSPTTLARAHHGSVSREQRSEIEEALKSGRLPAVVATSSLELGIDMGAVDLVIQVESPPSVASGLQRIGRAGHQVGAISRGVLFPKYRGDLLQSATILQRMREGQIERLTIPQNPLDIMAQQIVSMVAMDDWQVSDLLALLRRSAAYSELPESVFESVLDMLAGRYPSDAFAELRPRIVWDRVSGVLTARPGAQRLAVTSGGTIPDRGYFAVFLVGQAQARVGELDEEMVYESRVGDVISLGASSWRIEEISHDRVIVSPAPGQPGKLPFWHGDALGRPAEVGEAVGRLVREIATTAPTEMAARLAERGLDDRAAANLMNYIAEQRAATRAVPDDRTIVVERFRDEIGDWRIAVHSPLGGRVNAPWALLTAAAVRERLGIDAQAMPSDDGLVLRLPDTDDEADVEAALSCLFLPHDDVESRIVDELGGSALFASRFRECAARALLLPRRDPRRRTPLWAQRQRSAQLLGVASQHGTFPIVLETMRECLKEVYDVPRLAQMMQDVEERRVSVVTVDSIQPSPFAQSLMFGYVASFLYEGDSPLAERRAQALSLDATLLAELLGQADLRELLDLDAIVEIEAKLQRLHPERLLRSAEDLADALREIGPLSDTAISDRGGSTVWAEDLVGQRRAIMVRLAGVPAFAAIEDAGRLRDALGTALPVGIPEAHLEIVADPLTDLVSRFARTHGPFTSTQLAAHLGVGNAVATSALERMSAGSRLTKGEFTPGRMGIEWCDPEVLRRIRRTSIARLRKEIEPVDPSALAAFLPAWQGIAASGGQLSGVDGTYRAIEQLHGTSLPASALESGILGARVKDYEPQHLDTLLASGDIVWVGCGAVGGRDGWVSLAHSAAAAEVLPAALEPPNSPFAAEVLETLGGGGGWFLRDIAARLAVGSSEEKVLHDTLWDLVWSGLVSNDSLNPLRGLLRGSRATTAAGRMARPGFRSSRTSLRPRASQASPGRWFLAPERHPDATVRAAAAAEALLDRHGVLTRGAVVAERTPGGFAAAYRTLSAMEERGLCRRGYVVEGLGASQFALPGAVDRIRQPTRTGALTLAAADPANPFGAALPWPDRPQWDTHHPARKAGSYVVLVDGHLVMYLERGGKTLLTWSGYADALPTACESLAIAAGKGWLSNSAIESIDRAPALSADTRVITCLQDAGFSPTPKGLRYHGRRP